MIVQGFYYSIQWSRNVGTLSYFSILKKVIKRSLGQFSAGKSYNCVNWLKTPLFTLNGSALRICWSSGWTERGGTLSGGSTAKWWRGGRSLVELIYKSKLTFIVIAKSIREGFISFQSDSTPSFLNSKPLNSTKKKTLRDPS